MIIIYGSSTGNCEDAAERVAKALDCTNVKGVSTATKSDLEENNLLILGASTWGIGEMQDDFVPFLEILKATDLSGKKVAIFGTGDSSSFADSFVDAIGEIYEAVAEAGAEVLGFTETNEYTFDNSKAIINQQFAGLPLDYDNDSDKVDEQIKVWTAKVKEQL